MHTATKQACANRSIPLLSAHEYQLIIISIYTLPNSHRYLACTYPPCWSSIYLNILHHTPYHLPRAMVTKTEKFLYSMLKNADSRAVSPALSVSLLRASVKVVHIYTAHCFANLPSNLVLAQLGPHCGRKRHQPKCSEDTLVQV